MNSYRHVSVVGSVCLPGTCTTSTLSPVIVHHSPHFDVQKSLPPCPEAAGQCLSDRDDPPLTSSIYSISTLTVPLQTPLRRT